MLFKATDMMNKNNFAVIATVLLSVCLLQGKSHQKMQSSTSSPAIADNWKFGVALWTFHTVNFPESLKMVDSTGVQYIEPNTFHMSGPELNDSLLGDLSPAGVEKLKQMAKAHNL